MSRNKDIKKHTVETLNAVLKNRQLNFVHVSSLNGDEVILTDIEYGNYKVILKSFCDSSILPKHKARRHIEKFKAYKEKLLGTYIGPCLVLDVFYGPDRGYVNRSHYIEYRTECGHIGISTKVHLEKHKKSFLCTQCRGTEHGERKKVNGVRPKRTSTYNYWVANNSSFPEKYKSDYFAFKSAAGSKPAPRAKIIFIDNKPQWSFEDTAEDPEILLISGALRAAFKRSSIYLKALENAKVETEGGSKYRCAMCGELFARGKVQVDHIDPVAKLNGTYLQKEELIDRIWTDKVQVLDRKCHYKKTTIENRLRKQARKN